MTSRVAYLRFRARPGPNVRFIDPPPYEFEGGGFRGRLERDTLTLYPLGTFIDRNEALAAAIPLVRAWEIDAGLKNRGAAILFEHEYTALDGEAASLAMLRATATADVERQLREFPPAPADMAGSPEAEELFRRYRLFREGREPVQSVAYACLTKLEDSAGGPKGVTERYKISANVLEKWGKLASRPADPFAPRKYQEGAPTHALGSSVRCGPVSGSSGASRRRPARSRARPAPEASRGIVQEAEALERSDPPAPPARTLRRVAAARPTSDRH